MSVDGRCRAGTLEYTKRTLAVLFLWLLWGDVCFTLMAIVEPNIMPILLKDLGASNLVISVYITTIANILGFSVCPVVSVMSDRYRSRLGRRIPFLLLATPFVGLFLILVGFCREIGGFLTAHLFHSAVASEVSVTIGVVGIFVVGYQFFNTIVGSIYYYLFNDVVPQEYLGRILALARAVGTATGALFNFLVLQHARTHYKEIFVSFGIIYIIGFTVMCLRIKEGEYPPPPPREGGKNKTAAAVKAFFKESYCHRFYWYFYLSFAFWAMSGATGAFLVLRNLNIGLSLKEVGILAGISGVISSLLLVPAGYYVDKKHPIRVSIVAILWTLIFVPANAVFLWRMPHSSVLIWTIVITALTLPVGIIFVASELPMFMRLLPHSRYGQFSSANSFVSSMAMIIAGIVCGCFVDGLKWLCQDVMGIKGDYYYRLTFIWQAVFVVFALYFRVKLYKLWLKLGGDDGYVAPVFEEDEGALRRREKAGL